MLLRWKKGHRRHLASNCTVNLQYLRSSSYQTMTLRFLRWPLHHLTVNICATLRTLNDCSNIARSSQCNSVARVCDISVGAAGRRSMKEHGNIALWSPDLWPLFKKPCFHLSIFSSCGKTLQQNYRVERGHPFICDQGFIQIPMRSPRTT